MSDSYGPILLTAALARRTEKVVVDSQCQNLVVRRSRNGIDNRFQQL